MGTAQRQQRVTLMQTAKSILASGRFTPSGKSDLAGRVEALERYLILLTQELELRMSESE